MNARAALLLLVVAAAAFAAPSTPAATRYKTAGTCAGFPRVALEVPRGWCVALVADQASGLAFPRRIVEVAPGRFWIVDMGSWQANRGRVLELELAARGAPIALRVVVDKLDRPHGIAVGSDGRVYVGEAARIWRTRATLPIAAETVIDGLPADGAHPLKEIVFGAPGQLFVNVGSSSDACRDDSGALPLPGENSIDYSDENAPPEELNALVAGADYGWPTCVGARQPARGYEGRVDCTKTAAPALLWPAHVAPLQMLAVPASAQNAFAGQIVVAWHGYRAAGHRVVSYALDARGRPSGPPRVWIGRWSAVQGERPLGAPAGIFVDSLGRLFVVEDRNRTLLMLTRDDAVAPAASAPATTIR